MSDSLINKIIDQVNIVEVVGEYIDLQKKGRNFWGVCPFHQDSNPSMSVSPDKHIYKCFVCGAGGNVINFVADYEKISFGKALAKLGARVGIEVTNDFEPKASYNQVQSQLIAALKDANDFYQYSLTSLEAKGALEYAETRGLNVQIREAFKIGYAPNEGLKEFLNKKGHDESVLINASLLSQNALPFLKDRLTFGITNEYGDIIGFSGRLLKGEGPKYINSVESQVFDKSSILYNYYNAKDLIDREKEVYINEGFMDVIAMTKAGFKNSVAIMGTALTKNHIRKLKGLRVNLMLDADEAGVNATLKSIALLLANSISTHVVVNGLGKDPDEVVAKEGVEKLKEMVQNKISALQFAYEVLKKRVNPDSPEKIQMFIKEFAKYLSLSNVLEKDFYVSKIAKDLSLSNESIVSLIPDYQVNIEIKENNNFVKEFANKEEAKKEKPIEVKGENISYQVIKTFVNKPLLRKVILQDNVKANFYEMTMINLWKYICDLTQGKKVAPTQLQKELFDQIIGSDAKEVETTDEFESLIKNLNIESKNKHKAAIKKRLNESTDPEEKRKYLDIMIKLEKGK